MEVATVPRDAVTFLFTDIEGSTRLWEQSPDAMRGALAQHERIVRAAVEAHGGAIFKTVGDSVCSVFASPLRAVESAIAAQRALQEFQWPSETGELRVRMGVHTGNAIATEGDYFGSTVNRVSRIMSAAHGGQVLVSGATAQLVRATLTDAVLHDLGVHHLRDLTAPEELYQVVAVGLGDAFPALRTLDSHPNNLPTNVSNFVGREDELARLHQMLTQSRLITIAGPGGIGKTRLALQLAADSVGEFRDGVWFVNLAEIDDPELVAEKLASVLHVRSTAGVSIEERLKQHLARKHMLICFDNAELLVAPTAVLARELLTHCAQVSVMVTSREPLHVNGESVLRVGPMAIADERSSLAELEHFDATRLFLERARRVAPDRPLSQSDASAIQHICVKLDGIPLAIELASARTASMSVQDLDRRLGTGLKILVSKDPSESPRHRTVAAAIDWSYRILGEEDRRIFAGLSVFDGSFSLAAINGVIGSGPFELDAVDSVDSLVDKSFVATRVEHGNTRYRLLEPLRDFARQEAERRLPLDELRRIHFDYFNSVARSWETQRNADDERAYFQGVEREIANIRAALAWGLTRPELDSAFEMLLNLAPYWKVRGHTREARTWLDRALYLSGHTSDRLRAAVTRAAATFATIDDDYAAARKLSEASRTIFETIGDRGGAAEAVHNLAVIEHLSGDQERGRELYTQALDAFVLAGNTHGVMTALYNLGQICAEREDFQSAKAFYERGLAVCADCAQEDKRASFLSALAYVATKDGEFKVASNLYNQALQMKRDLGNEADAHEILVNMGALAATTGDLERALDYVRESAQIATALDSRSAAVECIESFSAILAKLGRTNEAIEALALSESLRDQVKYSRRDVRFAKELRGLRSRVLEADFAMQVAAARAQDWKEMAQRLLGSTQPN